MYDAFIIYSSKDRESVKKLVKQLKKYRLRVWFDIEQLEPGDSIVSKIEQGLKHSRWIVIVLSSNANASHWWRAEYAAALNREIRNNEQQVIPVLLESLDEDEIPFLLSDKHRINITESGGLQRLAERLRRRFSLSSYFTSVRNAPLLSGRLFNVNYHIEPSNLLQVLLREINFQAGEPIRAIRADNHPLDLTEFSQELITNKVVEAIVLLGEAGVGKTTTCKLLCRYLAQTKTSANIVPFHIPLGELRRKESFHEYLDRLVIGGTFRDLSSATKNSGRKLIVFLDGLNEQPHPVINSILVWAKRLIRSQSTTVVMTSRPMISIANVWRGDNVRLFELQRWTKAQLINFLEKNSALSFIDHVPNEALNCFRLPLLASLVIRRTDNSEVAPSLNTVVDVFEYILDQFFKSAAEKKKGQNISYSIQRLQGSFRNYLSSLAHQMTASNTIQIEARALEMLLPPETDRPHFKFILANLINSGLIRSANNMVALDPAATKRELRKLEIGFLHQSFQEYLTAQQLKTNWKTKLPVDISHDAFWREIPVYIIQSLANSSSRQEAFALSFLNRRDPDFLTAARLSGAIQDPGISKITKEEVLTQLLRNIATPKLYEFAIEAFIALSDTGRDGLRQGLLKPCQVNRVIAKFETHLINSRGTRADEDAWRPLGRSIYLLGELGDFWLVGYIDTHLEEIISIHLLYHVGESLLSLSRRADITDSLRQQIIKIAKRLSEVPHHDPVIDGYADAIKRACGEKSFRQVRLAKNLKGFLLNQTITERPHFKDEFWRRAHGAEAFAELITPKDGVHVLKLLFEAEELADYSGHAESGYNQVQSSILKSILRIRNSSEVQSADWRSFLETVFMSKRVAENAWACRHLEYLLIRWFSKTDDLNWLKKWQKSRSLGGYRIGNALSNTILLSS